MSSPVSNEVQQASAALKENRVDEALSLLQGAVTKAPDDFTANHLLGVTLGKAGRRPEAIACLLTATRLNPGSAAAQTHLGMMYAAADKAELARQTYQAALRADPSFAPAQTALSRLPAPPIAGAIKNAAAPVSSSAPAPTPWSATASSKAPAPPPVTTIASKARSAPAPHSRDKSLWDDIAEVQKEAKNEKYEIAWGRMMLQIGGAIVFCLGVILFFGNITGMLPTFPLAGFFVMALGRVMWKAG